MKRCGEEPGAESDSEIEAEVEGSDSASGRVLASVSGREGEEAWMQQAAAESDEHGARNKKLDGVRDRVNGEAGGKSSKRHDKRRLTVTGVEDRAEEETCRDDREREDRECGSGFSWKPARGNERQKL